MTIRASSLTLGMRCPGSVALRSSLGTQTPAMALGTMAHRYLELTLHEEAFGGPVLTDDPVLKDASIDFLQEMAKTVEWVRASGVIPDDEDRKYKAGRTELALSVWFGDNELTGHLDYCRESFDGKSAIIVDWKYGDGQLYTLPDMVEDWQMVAYGILWAKNNPDVERVFIRRVLLSDRVIDELILEGDDLSHAIAAIEVIVTRIHDNPDLFTPGTWCDHCPARSHCSALNEEISKHAGTLLLPSLGTMQITTEQLTRWAYARKAVQVASERLDKELRAAIENGQVILRDNQRLKLIGGRMDKVVAHREAYEILRGACGETAMDAISVTKGGIEDALRKIGMSTDDIKAFINSLRAMGVVTTVERTPSLRWGKA